MQKPAHNAMFLHYLINVSQVSGIPKQIQVIYNRIINCIHRGYMVNIVTMQRPSCMTAVWVCLCVADVTGNIVHEKEKTMFYCMFQISVENGITGWNSRSSKSKRKYTDDMAHIA